MPTRCQSLNMPSQPFLWRHVSVHVQLALIGAQRFFHGELHPKGVLGECHTFLVQVNRIAIQARLRRDFIKQLLVQGFHRRWQMSGGGSSEACEPMFWTHCTLELGVEVNVSRLVVWRVRVGDIRRQQVKSSRPKLERLLVNFGFAGR